MTEQDWMQLNINDRVSCVNSSYANNLLVGEICEDDRSLKNWREKGYPSANRLCKMVGENGFHTWSADHNNWVVVK